MAIHVTGDVSGGQIAAGQFVYQAQALAGGVINQIQVEGDVIALRPLPIDGRPRRVDPVFGRSGDLARLADLVGRAPVQLFGAEGSGKTWLVSELVHGPVADRARDGVAYLPARDGPIEDVLQALFELFHDSRLPQLGLKPTLTQIRTAFAERQAFVAVDDLGGTRADLELLLEVLRDCEVVIVSEEETLLGGGSTMPVDGLTDEPAMELFVHILGRPLADDEPERVRAFCDAVHGIPGEIVRMARRLARGDSVPSPLGTTPPGAAELDVADRRILSCLAATAPTALPPAAVAVIADVSDAEARLESLRERRLVLAASPRFRLPSDLVSPFLTVEWRGRALDVLPTWFAEASEAQAIDAGPAAEQIAAWGVETGNHTAVVALARGAVPRLAAGRRWGSARALAAHARRAAAAIGDLAAQGWALHELGTFAAGSGDVVEAAQLLQQAEPLRLAAGDTTGAAITRHNLNQLGVASIVPTQPVTQELVAASARPRPRFLRLLAALFAISAAVVAGLLIYDALRGDRAGALGLSDDEIDFGTVAPDREPTLESIVLSNDGDVAFTVETVELRNGDGFEVSHDCRRLQPGDLCTLAVAFVATEPGSYSASVEIFTDLDPDPGEVRLRGVVEREPADLRAVPRRLDFGAVASNTDDPEGRSVTVFNAGRGSVSLERIGMDTGDVFTAEHDCPDELEPGVRCSVQIEFGADEAGTYEDDLVVEHPGGELRVRVVAELAVGSLRSDPDEELDFGFVSDDVTEEDVLLINDGRLPVEIRDVRLAIGDYFDIESVDCPVVLPPGGACSVTIAAFYPDVDEPPEDELIVEHEFGVLRVTLRVTPVVVDTTAEEVVVD